MSKDHEQFLLKCELAKTMLMRVWAKGLITDEEMEKSMERIEKKQRVLSKLISFFEQFYGVGQ